MFAQGDNGRAPLRLGFHVRGTIAEAMAKCEWQGMVFVCITDQRRVERVCFQIVEFELDDLGSGNDTLFHGEPPSMGRSEMARLYIRPRRRGMVQQISITFSNDALQHESPTWRTTLVHATSTHRAGAWCQSANTVDASTPVDMPTHRLGAYPRFEAAGGKNEAREFWVNALRDFSAGLDIT